MRRMNDPEHHDHPEDKHGSDEHERPEERERRENDERKRREDEGHDHQVDPSDPGGHDPQPSDPGSNDPHPSDPEAHRRHIDELAQETYLSLPDDIRSMTLQFLGSELLLALYSRDNKAHGIREEIASMLQILSREQRLTYVGAGGADANGLRFGDVVKIFLPEHAPEEFIEETAPPGALEAMEILARLISGEIIRKEATDSVQLCVQLDSMSDEVLGNVLEALKTVCDMGLSAQDLAQQRPDLLLYVKYLLSNKRLERIGERVVPPENYADRPLELLLQWVLGKYRRTDASDQEQQ